MRIYLMAVGTRDPFWMRRKEHGSLEFNAILDQYGPEYTSKNLDLISGPILSFFQQQAVNEEDWIVLISTEGESPVVDQPTVRGGEATKAELQRRYSLPNGKIVHRSLKNVDPSNFGAIAKPMRQLVQSVLQTIHQIPSDGEVERIVNVSPGTPQMQAVWYLMVNFGQLQAQLLQMKQRPDRIEPVSISPLLAEQFIELGLNFFQDYSFNAAAEAFKRAANVLGTYEPERARRAELARDIASAYHYWSIFQHQKAASTLQQLVNSPAPDLPAELSQMINQQTEFLKKLSEPIPKHRAINAFHMAWLEYNRHDPVESIWRAKAAYEQVLVERALKIAEDRSGFRPNPDNFENSLKQQLGKPALDNRSLLKKFFAECQRLEILQESLGSLKARPLLEEWDRGFKWDSSFWKLRAKEELTEVRNQMIHYFRPLTMTEAMKGLEFVKEALERTFGKEILNELDACPFSSQRLHSVKEHLAALLKG